MGCSLERMLRFKEAEKRRKYLKLRNELPPYEEYKIKASDNNKFVSFTLA